MTQQFPLVYRRLAVLVFVAATITSVTASAGTVVYVADVESLYDAMGSGSRMRPTNRGATKYTSGRFRRQVRSGSSRSRAASSPAGRAMATNSSTWRRIGG